jgi:hypothetical protein
MRLDEFLSHTKVTFAVEKHSLKICRVRSISNEAAVAVIRAGNEITVVAPTTAVLDSLEERSGYRMISFITQLPFELTGLMAFVISRLAEEEIPVFVLSSFSTDHLLVKADHVDRARRALERAGFREAEAPAPSP